MSNPNTYGGGSSNRGQQDRGKGSADQEILDGLLPRIETRGQSSRTRSSKDKDGKKKKGSTHKSVARQPSLNPASALSASSSAAPVGGSSTSRGGGSGVGDERSSKRRKKADTTATGEERKVSTTSSAGFATFPSTRVSTGTTAPAITDAELDMRAFFNLRDIPEESDIASQDGPVGHRTRGALQSARSTAKGSWRGGGSSGGG